MSVMVPPPASASRVTVAEIDAQLRMRAEQLRLRDGDETYRLLALAECDRLLDVRNALRRREGRRGL